MCHSTLTWKGAHHREQEVKERKKKKTVWRREMDESKWLFSPEHDSSREAQKKEKSFISKHLKQIEEQINFLRKPRRRNFNFSSSIPFDSRSFPM